MGKTGGLYMDELEKAQTLIVELLQILKVIHEHIKAKDTCFALMETLTTAAIAKIEDAS